MTQSEKNMDDDQLCVIVAAMVTEAENYRSERAPGRVKAMEYFDGTMNDVPADEGKSQVVSRDVRSAVKKVLPSLIRTILGNDEIVEFLPVGEGDEEGSDQATDFVNYVALPECDGRQSIEDSINDALCLRNGILKWHQETMVDVKVSLHTGLDEDSFTHLVSDDDVEVLEHSERAETIETPQGDQDFQAHDVKIRRRITNSRPMIKAIPLENWLIHPDAIRLEDSPILGENCRLRRSDLVKMGYDRAIIDGLPAAGASVSDRDSEEEARRRDTFSQGDIQSKSLDEIEFYDLLVRVDYDDDGIAELRRLVFAGGIKAEYLLENTEWDEINYADIVSERRPHQWEGTSIPDDVMEIQKIKTVLLRQTLDNLYWQNNLQPIIQEGQIVNPESVMNPKFGEPIRVAQGVDVRAAVGHNIVPMVADKSFSMLAYLDEESRARSYLTDGNSVLSDFNAALRSKQEIDAMIEGVKPAVQRQLIPIRNALDDALAKASAPYAGARDTFRQQSKAIEAIDTGKNAASGRMRSDDTISQFSAMSPDEQSAFRAGYVDPLIGRVEATSMSPSTNKARGLITPKTGAEFPAFAVPGKADQMGARIAREQRMFETTSTALGGSKTADNLADAADLAKFDPAVMSKLMRGDVVGAIMDGISKAKNQVTGMTPPVIERLSKSLMETNPENALKILNSSAAQKAASAKQRDMIRSLIIGTGSGGTPRILGQEKRKSLEITVGRPKG